MKGRSRAAVLIVTVVLVAAVSALTGCAPSIQPPPGGTIQTGSARAAADQVLAAIKGQDGAALSAFVHPDKGVRFSPYAFVDVKSDVVLTGEQVASLWDSTKVYTWGAEDGTGDRIKLTPAKYAERYIFDRDFTAATSVSENSDKASGNTVNNAAEVYPNGTRIEYYVTGTSASGQPGNDWRALRLVFEKIGDSWFLVGVIHDEWTI
jgi:hypothetical protein